MMDLSQVQAIVDANVKRIRDQLYLHDWRVNMHYENLADPNKGMNNAANMTVQPEYKTIDIRLDPAQITDEEHVLRMLRHELIHAFIWPMVVYGQTHEDDESQHESIVWTFAMEQMVWQVENLLRIHGVELKDDGELVEGADGEA